MSENINEAYTLDDVITYRANEAKWVVIGGAVGAGTVLAGGAALSIGAGLLGYPDIAAASGGLSLAASIPAAYVGGLVGTVDGTGYTTAKVVNYVRAGAKEAEFK